MKIFLNIPSCLVLLASALLFAACSSEEDAVVVDEDFGKARIEVPVGISLEGAWNVDEQTPRKAPPPGAGGGNAGGGGTSTISDGWVYDADIKADLDNVDVVRIIAFRRKDTSDGEGTTEPFRYDASNDKTLSLSWTDVAAHENGYDGAHKHRYASGTVTKVAGYEYRIIALAYNSTRAVPFAASGSYNNELQAGEQNWFTLNAADGLALGNFAATIRTQTTDDADGKWREYLTGNTSALGAEENTSNLSRKLMASPQLFWGYLHLEGDDEPIIRFQTTNASGDLVSDSPLTGLLYRGMAKVELHINLQQRDKGAGTQNVNWLALMADHLQTQVGLSDYDDFLTPQTPITEDGKFTAIDFITSSSAGTKVLTAWILPTRTRLAIRGQYQLALGAHRVDNGQLCADNISYGDMGTGIIAADVADNWFTFRRNHKYVLNCSSSEAIFNNHEIN